MKALVTGVTGFVGHHLAARLAADGWEVVALTREGSDPSAVPAGVTVGVHDGTASGMRRLVAGAAPDVVFHLASLFLSEHRTEQLDDLIAANVLLGAQLADACAEEGPHALVNAGTSWQHFETDGYRPVNLYAATKQAFEDLLAWYVDATPLSAITLQLFDTYGPADRRRKLFAILRDAVAQDTELAMSAGEQQLDLVHVDDAARAFVVAGERLLQGGVDGHEVYGVSSGSPLTLRAFVELFGEVAGRPVRVQWGGRPYREREVMTLWRPPAALPGWRPEVALRDGIARTLAAPGG